MRQPTPLWPKQGTVAVAPVNVTMVMNWSKNEVNNIRRQQTRMMVETSAFKRHLSTMLLGEDRQNLKSGIKGCLTFPFEQLNITATDSKLATNQ